MKLFPILSDEVLTRAENCYTQQNFGVILVIAEFQIFLLIAILAVLAIKRGLA